MDIQAELVRMEVFTHVDPSTDPPTIRHFNVSAMTQYIYSHIFLHGAVPKDVEVLRCPLDEELIRHIETNGGVEEEQIQRLTAEAGSGF